MRHQLNRMARRIALSVYADIVLGRWDKKNPYIATVGDHFVGGSLKKGSEDASLLRRYCVAIASL